MRTNWLHKIRQKQYSLESLLKEVAAWKAGGERIVFTNGCFDILHPGHIDYLAKAATLGDKLIIGLNSDASVKRLKGETRPLQNQQARMFILAALAFTDAIILFNEDTPYQLLSQIKPHILVKGADYKINQVIGADIVTANGGSVALLPYLPGNSTSGIIARMG